MGQGLSEKLLSDHDRRAFGHGYVDGLGRQDIGNSDSDRLYLITGSFLDSVHSLKRLLATALISTCNP